MPPSKRAKREQPGSSQILTVDRCRAAGTRRLRQIRGVRNTPDWVYRFVRSRDAQCELRSRGTQPGDADLQVKTGVEEIHESPVSHGTRSASTLRTRFQQLVTDWKTETRFCSSVSQIAMHQSYQKIIGLGPAVLPLILRELRDHPGHWFWALQAIAHEDPVSESDRGDIRAMTHAWLVWGRRRKLIQ